MLPSRVLIIAAKSSADIASAANIVRRYKKLLEDYPRSPGRRNGVLYCDKGDDRYFRAYVWHTKNQMTVHFGD